MYAITSLGNPGEIVFIVMGLLVIFMIARRWQIAACLGLGFLLTSSVTEYAKNFFRIARPNMPYATSVGNWSFPSGHTTGTTIVFLIVAFGLVAIIRNKALKVSCASLCGLIIFLVGISRIYIGVHWLSDVIGGWLFAGGIGLIVLGCAAMISSLLARFRFRRI
jgi:undecaprenyl-diphosphatase